MYSKYENPILIASFFYFDNTYDDEVSANVLSILKKHNFFPPEKIYADRLTNDRYIDANENTENLFVKSYSENKVMGIDMASGDGRVGSEFWRFSWYFTLFKDFDRDFSNTVFKPWNVISISSTYGRLKNTNNYDDFFNCVKAIIAEIKPLYACIDDVDKKVTKYEKQYRTQPLRINDQTPPNEVYWGNYWCGNYIKNSNPDAFEYLRQNGAICENIAGGVYFCMTNSAFDFKSKRGTKMERKFSKMMKKR